MALAQTLFGFETTQATMARAVKSMLDLNQQIGERQRNQAMALLRGTLGACHPAVLSTMRALLDVQLDLTSGLGSQWKTTLDTFIERCGACVGDLRRADDHNEMPGILLMFADHVNQQMRADSERLAQLLSSASSAGRILAMRGLDEMASDTSDEGHRDLT
ncbi:hypothetical protein GJ699_14380 [Duganella sp. FT80W]|uniref:Uncharacterized protein n=1 Tax=Duganella guangzhouensis TaxID=2666084 RepID=A0A6I2L4L3_9BURK|nr:hypothetical protein [Duganella guangzhouensis]MRW91179.1 hypothetical protein [Duganella guangzhouensis]